MMSDDDDELRIEAPARREEEGAVTVQEKRTGALTSRQEENLVEAVSWFSFVLNVGPTGRRMDTIGGGSVLLVTVRRETAETPPRKDVAVTAIS